MLPTYQGILHGDRIEWSGDAPHNLSPDRVVKVHVTLVEKSASALTPTEQGRRMAAALEKIAQSSALADIPDPEAWQREVRTDRPLPDRDE